MYVQRLFDMALTWEDSPQSPAPATRSYRTMPPLRMDQIDELVVAYQAGATTKQLAAKFVSTATRSASTCAVAASTPHHLA